MTIPRLLQFIALAAGLAASCRAAPPTMLPGPADWRFERLPIPPGFARDITWTGYEEARFSPGMFNPASPDHFTYALSIYVERTEPLQPSDLKDFLGTYFKGLSLGIGQRKGLKLDPTQFSVEVTPQKDTGAFTAKVTCFDSFNDGGKITLNIEAEARLKASAKKMMLILLISPQAFDAAAWRKLREVREAATEP